MKNRNTSYWACQIGGWAAFSLLGVTTAAMESGWRPSIVIGYLFFFLYSVSFTHLLRLLALRRGWTNLTPARAFARLSLGATLIATIQTGLVVGVYSAIEGSLGVWRQPSSIVYMFLWLTVVGNIWVILYFSITSLRHTREVRRNETQMKLALSEAELRALESQLNPHFLFNCLNSIRGMVSEDPPQAQDMITRLANILRYNLQRDRRHTVPLASEVEIVSDYLALESIRFESRLRVRIAIDDQAREVPVPPHAAADAGRKRDQTWRRRPAVRLGNLHPCLRRQQLAADCGGERGRVNRTAGKLYAGRAHECAGTSSHFVR
jgi:two-component system, LytTR family, sensor histidine kinase AlgZ